jgi:hypothetical protein
MSLLPSADPQEWLRQCNNVLLLLSIAEDFNLDALQVLHVC